MASEYDDVRIERVRIEQSDVDDLRHSAAWQVLADHVIAEIKGCQDRQAALNAKFVRDLGVAVTVTENGVTTTTEMTPEKFMIESAVLAERVLVLQSFLAMPEFLADLAEDNMKQEEAEEDDDGRE